MSDDPENSGYGKPPVEHQFAKGKSGNPKGRPKKAHKRTGLNVKLPTLIRREAERVVTIMEDGQSVEITMGEALTKRLYASAMKGSASAMRLLIVMLDKELKSNEMSLWDTARMSKMDPHEASRAYRAMRDAIDC